MSKRSAKGDTLPKKPRVEEPEPETQEVLPKVSKLEQKRQHLRERPHGELIIELNSTWTDLLKSETPNDQKTILCETLHQALVGKYLEIARNKRGTRYVQAVLKFGTPDQRSIIITELSGHFVEFSRTSFTRHVMARVFKHCSTDLLEIVSKELLPAVPALIKHAEGALVVDDLFQSVKSIKNVVILTCLSKEIISICELEQLDPKVTTFTQILDKRAHKRDQLINQAIETITSIFSKNMGSLFVVQNILYEILKNCSPLQIRDSICPLLKDHFMAIIHTSIGSKITMIGLRHSTAKDRRTFLKNLKPNIPNLCIDQHAYSAVIVALATVDDTSALFKNIVKDILNNLRKILYDKYGSMVVNFLIVGSESKRISQSIKEMIVPVEIGGELSSKKDQKARNSELMTSSFENLIEFLGENFIEILSSEHGQYVLIDGLNHLSNFVESSNDEIFSRKFNDFLSSIMSSFPLNDLSSDEISRPLKRLVLNAPENFNISFKNLIINSGINFENSTVNFQFLFKTLFGKLKEAKKESDFEEFLNNQGFSL
ncbi:hypothetical protein RCL1_003000 [Eukaryota sp. TZLM3-RCL]